MGRLKCGFRKKSDSKPCTIPEKTQKMTKDHEQQQFTLIEFLRGLSTFVAKTSKTVA
jgi:hypothetical protein